MVGDAAQPADFTLKEYEDYSAKVAQNPPPAIQLETANNEDEEEEEEDDDDDDEEEDGDMDFIEGLKASIVAKFKETQGEPTADEVENLLEKVIKPKRMKKKKKKKKKKKRKKRKTRKWRRKLAQWLPE